MLVLPVVCVSQMDGLVQGFPHYRTIQWLQSLREREGGRERLLIVGPKVLMTPGEV